MATTAEALPRWDMSVVYPGLESPEFASDFASVVKDVEQLRETFDRLKIGKQLPGPLSDRTVAAFDEAVTAYNAVLERFGTLSAYIHAFVSTDSRDAAAQARDSELRGASTTLSQLGTRFTAWIGGLDTKELIKQSVAANEHQFMIERAREAADHLMAPGEEALAAELNVTGGGAWARLHSNVTSQLAIPVTIGGLIREMPMSVVRNLAFDADRETRRAGYEAEIAGWERVAVPLAAAMNSIKGEVNTLAARRGWASALDQALFQNNIDRKTLDAMMTAARESFPDFRRYFHAKAKLVGVRRLAWYDLFAPTSANERAWPYREGTAFIVEKFGSFSDNLAAFADRAFRENWIDAEPRSGKVDGAFCMRLRADESRVLANYRPGYKSVSTLAHELGHGYHNSQLARRTALNRSTPMALAETASIFCETIIRNAVLDTDIDRGERLEILDAALENASQVVVDITSRFDFETAVFTGRLKRELSVDELNEAMLDAQRGTYGDGLDPDVLHPYMWAVKGHFYSTGRSYYNYPYMFGLLFGLGLYARYRQDRAGFVSRYDDLLSSTGRADAATLAKDMGIDIRSVAFWRASLDTVREDIDRFVEMVG